MDDRAVRYRCDLEALISLPDGRRVPGRVLELSASGAFVQTELEVEFGQALRVYFDLPGSDDPFFADGKVARIGKGQYDVKHPSVENLIVLRPGVGVRFTGLPEGEEGRLHGFLELLDER